MKTKCLGLEASLRLSILFMRILPLLLIVSSLAVAQPASFPLNTGETWTWGSTGLVPNLPVRTLGDTTMPNGTTYRIISALVSPPEKPTVFWLYLRQVGNRVYRYDSNDPKEILFFDFDVSPDSVFSKFPSPDSIGNGSVKLLRQGIDTLFGVPRRFWDFYYNPVASAIDEEITYHVTDTLGITGVQNVKIVGASINGQSYGSLTAIRSDNTPIPTFRLDPPYPNPFNGQTSITINIQATEYTKLSVFDLMGREIEILFEGELSPGPHAFRWEAQAFSTGTYLLRAS